MKRKRDHDDHHSEHHQKETRDGPRLHNRLARRGREVEDDVPVTTSLLVTSKAWLSRWFRNVEGAGDFGVSSWDSRRSDQFVKSIVSVLGDIMDPAPTFSLFKTLRGEPIYEYRVAIPYPNALGFQEMDKLAKMEGVVNVAARRAFEEGQFSLVVTCCEGADSGALQRRFASDHLSKVVSRREKNSTKEEEEKNPAKAVWEHVTECIEIDTSEKVKEKEPYQRHRDGTTIYHFEKRVKLPVATEDMQRLTNSKMVRDAQLQAVPQSHAVSLLLQIYKP